MTFLYIYFIGVLLTMVYFYYNYKKIAIISQKDLSIKMIFASLIWFVFWFKYFKKRVSK